MHPYNCIHNSCYDFRQGGERSEGKSKSLLTLCLSKHQNATDSSAKEHARWYCPNPNGAAVILVCFPISVSYFEMKQRETQHTSINKPQLQKPLLSKWTTFRLVKVNTADLAGTPSLQSNLRFVHVLIETRHPSTVQKLSLFCHSIFQLIKKLFNRTPLAIMPSPSGLYFGSFFLKLNTLNLHVWMS